MWLKVESGDGRGNTVEITKRQFLIGRDAECDLVLADERASRQHARVETLDTGGMVIRDLGTTNGTFVDGQRVSEPVVLEGGEKIRVGRTELSVSRNEPVPLTAFDPGSRVADQPAGDTGTGAAAPAAAAAPTASTIERAELRKSVKRSTVIAAVTGGLVAVLVIVLVIALATGGLGGADEASTPEIVEDLEPSTVLVNQAIGGDKLGTGTGWVLDADRGLIVTNYHVIDSGTDFSIGINGRTYTARVVAAAPCEDLAMLQVENAQDLQNIAIGSQSELEEGDRVVAVGYPGNLSTTSTLQATEGVVSAVKTRSNRDSSDHVYHNLVQTDAAINPGNSGGPLVNEDSELVGVNTLGGVGKENQAYAIGVDLVKGVTDGFANGTSPGWSGLGLGYYLPEEVRERIIARMGFNPSQSGMLVLNQIPGTTARQLLGNDPALLVAIDGFPVTDMASYCKAVRGYETGDNADYTFLLPGDDQPVTGTIAFS